MEAVEFIVLGIFKFKIFALYLSSYINKGSSFITSDLQFAG